MPDVTDSESASGKRGYRTPRPDDLRNLHIDPRRPADTPNARTSAPDAGDEGASRGRPTSSAGDWIEPGQSRPSASDREWIDPRNRPNESDDDSNQTPWQRMFGGAGAHAEAQHLGKPPNHLKRLVAFFVDAIIIAVALSVVFPVVLGQPYLDIDPWMAWIQEAVNQANLAQGNGAESVQPTISAPETSPVPTIGINLPFGLVVVVYILYHGVLLGLVGATVGKRLMGITVYGPDGLPIGVPRAVIRSVGLCLTATIAAIGFLIVLIHPRRRALHDLIAGSHPIEREPSFERVDQT